MERYFAISEDEQVKLRALQSRDAVRLHRMWNGDAVAESFREGTRNRSLVEAESYIFFARGKSTTGKDLALEYRGEFAGCVTWQYGSGVREGSAEISYWVGQDFWGKGIATTGVRLIMPFLYEKKKMHRLYAEVASCNLASCKVLEHCGFRKEGILRDALVISGKKTNCILYGKLKAEHEQEKKPR